MYESPSSLEELCLDTVCEHILMYIEPVAPTRAPTQQPLNLDRDLDSPDSPHECTHYKFKDDDIFLFNEISEKLMKKLMDKNLLCDPTMFLFNEKNTKLRSVKLKNCKVTQVGLQVLKQHKITDLECYNLKNISIANILDCLSVWSICNMTSVNFTKCSFIDLSRHTYMVVITQLKNLRHLNLSHTGLNQVSFELICEDLRHLEKLDVSGTFVRDLSPLEMLAEKLVSLSISDLPQVKNYVSTLIQLRQLRHLDLSLFNEKIDSHPTPLTTDGAGGAPYPVTEFLEHTSCMPHLVSLDLSGWKDVTSAELVLKFVEAHPKLEFLGVVLNDVIYNPAFSCENFHGYLRHLVVAGLGNEAQIKVALKTYRDRSHYVQKALYFLFQLTNVYPEARPDVFNLVLPVMAAHSNKFGVQMAATACLYNLTRNIPVSLEYSKSASSKIRPWIAKMRLTDLNRFCHHALKYLRWDVLKKSTGKTLFQPVLFFKAWRVFDYLHPRGEMSKKIHPSALGRGVNLTLYAMECFPEEYQLQKNSLLTLCSDTILQDINFDRFRCAKLVLDALCAFDDVNMNRMAVAICSILAAKVSTEETSELGARPIYMRKLLAMVQTRIDTVTADITLKFTLSALWNLTDESAPTCTVFLALGGADLFLNVLQTFKDDSAIETKVLGLLNNIAEVQKLRHSLMLNSLVSELHFLLKSENIDVSYFAAGIIAHLASDGPEKWTVNSHSRQHMLIELEQAVTSWKIPDSEMVAYRSFRPFFSLLRIDVDYQVQLWAVWAIHHVCTKNPKRYCVMLQEEKGHLLLTDLINYPDSHSSIRSISSQILETLTTTTTTTNSGGGSCGDCCGQV